MKYIAAIDGLRAIAVTSVILNHLNHAYLPSGFLGVDIFFIISGFVVTGSLVGRNHNQDKKLWQDFYIRRVKRLFPALLTCVLSVSFIAHIFIKNPITSIKTGAYSLLGVSNFFLIIEGLQYFNLEAMSNLFTHTWSLSVEEQFYLVFPWLFIFFYTTQRKIVSFKIILIVLSLVSFIAYVYFFYTNYDWSFYLMPSRFWQLSLGCLAFLEKEKLITRIKNHAVLLRHTAFFLIAGFLFSPGNYQLVSTISISILTAFLLITLDSKPFFLTKKIFVNIGLISYSLYLWHWPVIVIFRQLIGLNIWNNFLIILITTFLALSSYHFVEKPLRFYKPNGSNKKKILIYLCCLPLLVFFILNLSPKYGKKMFTGNIHNSRFSLKDSDGWDNKNCRHSRTSNTKSLKTKDYFKCEIETGAEKSSPSIYVYGDSYSEQIIPAFLKIAKEERFQLFASSTAGCHIIEAKHRRETSGAVCTDFFNNFLEFVKKNAKKGDLFVIAISGDYFDSNNDFSISDKLLSAEDSIQLYQESLTKTQRTISSIGAKLFITSNIPKLKLEPDICIQPWSQFRPDCTNQQIINSKTTNKVIKLDSRMKLFCQRNQIEFLDIMMPISQIIKNSSEPKRWLHYYYNLSHLSKSGAEKLSPYIKIQL